MKHGAIEARMNQAMRSEDDVHCSQNGRLWRDVKAKGNYLLI
jgi:hypothetical protein